MWAAPHNCESKNYVRALQLSPARGDRQNLVNPASDRRATRHPLPSPRMCRVGLPPAQTNLWPPLPHAATDRRNPSISRPLKSRRPYPSILPMRHGEDPQRGRRPHHASDNGWSGGRLSHQNRRGRGPSGVSVTPCSLQSRMLRAFLGGMRRISLPAPYSPGRTIRRTEKTVPAKRRRLI
jgi:hypothetical protein